MMKKLTILLLSFLITGIAFSKSVSIEKASLVANNYFAHHSGKAIHSIEESFSHSYNGITTYHVFNFTGGGFVVVSADDAAIPVLAQSGEGFIEKEITNPNLKFWFDCYNKEIAHAVASKAGNESTIDDWNSILSRQMDNPYQDVAPLCSTTWDQNTWYNYYCPTASGGPSGKAYTGCVATAIGQLMKYYNFPAKGIGSHTYNHQLGLQSADFSGTNYNFAAMGAKATSASYLEIAKLLYHAGVAVNMDYKSDGSGAFSEEVPWVMGTYFNYDLSTIKFASKINYNNTNWYALIKAELDANRPVYYSGSGPGGGHAWVCDGYRNSDSKFHMNWGWSGSSNGYFAISTSSMVAGGNTFNTNFAVIYGIKPGNPNLIVRIKNLNETNFVPHGPDFNIDCAVTEGNPTSIKLFIDNQLVYNSSTKSFTYKWKTSSVAYGTHILRVEATEGPSTVFHEVKANLSEWQPQVSGFKTSSRGIQNLHAIDTLVAWATAYDGSGAAATINEFTKTTNGGVNWVPGQVLGGSVYGLGNICALNANVAYVSVFHKTTQDNTCGVYKTSNGGANWAQLPGALQGSASFANNVWFWDENTGMCHGDVKDNYFEIYTTINGGSSWTRVPKANIGGGTDPVSGEGGWTSVIEAVGTNTIMFGTNKGNLYISHDKGLHWTVSNTGITPLTDGVQKISFKDDNNGLVVQNTTTVVLRETHDGGQTWKTITPTGPFLTSDLAYIPGTDATYVSTGAASGATGASYSFDGGHTWAQIAGTENDQFLACDFVNTHCGWAGGFSLNALKNGMNKYVGWLEPGAILNPVTNLIAQPLNNNVNLLWNEPATTPLSYNIYRNDTLIRNTSMLQFSDQNVANGQQYYCVSALYPRGESQKSCTTTWITLGISNTDEAAYKVFPNPASKMINVVSPVRFDQIQLINSVGQVVYNNNIKGTNLQIFTEGLNQGIYILQIHTAKQVISKKVLIKK